MNDSKTIQKIENVSSSEASAIISPTFIEKKQIIDKSTSPSPILENLGKCLVIGGAGLLGRAIVDLLIKEGQEVRILDLKPALNTKAESIIGDIRNINDIELACDGVKTVFQTAAAVWNPSLPKKVYYDVNIKGNQNVIDTCIKFGIPRLVYTSTMDVVCSDERKHYCDVDETYSYPEKMPKDPYSRTKIIAEKAVLKAKSDGLLVCALRPVGMYGPGDKYHIANIVKMAKEGNRMKIGDGSARFSHVYSENAAYAHILAAKNLYPGSLVCGECYFICDHQPAENLFTFMEPFLESLGLPTPNRSIPYRLAYFFARFAEIFAPKSNFNRFSVIQTCLDHTFVSDKAERDFGYKPIVTKEEAFKKTINWFKKELEAGSFD